MKFRMPSSRVGVVAIAVGALALSGTGGAIAAASITGKDIVNRSIEKVDLAPKSVNSNKVADGSLKFRDMASGVKDAINRPGPQGPAGPAGPAGAEYVGENWSIVDRNVVGSGDSYLRSGPADAPSGVGSLGLRTGSNTDKAAFGNQVDFVGQDLPSTVSYFVYTTGENKKPYPENAPSVTFEVDPTGVENDGTNYSSLVYVPVEAVANAWSKLDASEADRWFMTGAAGTESNCTQGSYCTLAEVKAAFPDADLLTAQITKGRDYAFSGAIDALTIDGTTYDFEPNGVHSN